MPYILRCVPHVTVSQVSFPFFHRPTRKKTVRYICFLLTNLKNMHGFVRNKCNLIKFFISKIYPRVSDSTSMLKFTIVML
jgi:hypothetical protein